LIAVACDGAGSASRSLDGATLTVDRFLHEFGDAIRRSGLDEITKEFVHGWLSKLRAEIDDRAEAHQLTAREFACTLLAAIISEDQAAIVNAGEKMHRRAGVKMHHAGTP
jgi:serine/threonine protein phosphatase PrpC